jgi:hypothetical protein
MDTLAPAASIGVVNKNGFPDAFQIVHKYVVNNAIAEISGKYLTQFRLFGKKADRTTGAVGAIIQLSMQSEQFPLLIDLKPQRIDGIPFVLSAEQVLPKDIFKGKEQEETLSAANG